MLLYYIKLNFYFDLVGLVINVIGIIIAYNSDRKFRAELAAYIDEDSEGSEDGEKKENLDINKKDEKDGSEIPLITYPTPS